MVSALADTSMNQATLAMGWFLIIPIGLMVVRSLVPDSLRLEHEELALSRHPQRPGFTEAFGIVSDTLKRIPLPQDFNAREAPRMLWMRGRERCVPGSPFQS